MTGPMPWTKCFVVNNCQCGQVEAEAAQKSKGVMVHLTSDPEKTQSYWLGFHLGRGLWCGHLPSLEIVSLTLEEWVA